MTAPDTLRRTLEGLTFGHGQRFENFEVIPIIGSSDSAPGYVTLDEALAHGDIEITEVSEAGQVSELEVSVKGASPVLLVDGEELVGAKQNRVLNLTILAPARKETRVPVSCVEAGRWRHTSRRFGSSPRTQFAQGRAAKTRAVSASLESHGLRHSDQGEVWNLIAEKSSRLSVSSDTSAMSAMYERLDSSIDAFVNATEPVAGQVGALFFINGEPAGLDLFDNASTWRKLAPKLVRGYALDAIDRRSTAAWPSDSALAEAFAQRVRSSDVSVFQAAGEGDDVRLRGASITGAALVANERVVHVSAFPVGA